MKRIFFHSLVFANLFFLQNEIAAQLNCSRFPTSDILLKALSQKPVGVHHSYFIPGCNVNDSIKNKILYLLNWKWTNEEINDFINRDFEENKSFYNIEKRAMLISQGKDSLYKLAVDSITRYLKVETYNSLAKYNAYRVDDGLILTAAKLNVKEAIPILYKALNDSLHYKRNVVELALARFGDKKLQQDIINTCNYKKKLNGYDWVEYYRNKIALKLIFTSTQESICKLNEWLDTSKMYRALSEGDKVDTKNSYNVMIDLKYIIMNKDFQDKLKGVDLEPPNKGNDDLILFCKEWLLKNKGKYDIYKYYCPY